MGNDNYQESLKAAMDLEEAMDYIDQIFSAKILEVYGLALAIGLASSEFDQIMSLAEKPPAGLDSVFLEAFKFVLENIPVVGQAKEVVERIQHIVKVMGTVKLATTTVEATNHLLEDGKQVDSLEPDEDKMKIIRSIASKKPLYQQILWARYQVEYDRRKARAQFRSSLRAALDSKKFAGKPIDMARQQFGAAPPDLAREEVYKQFEVVQKSLLRELFRTYTRKYVTILEWIHHYPPPNPMTDTWMVQAGFNQPQWDAVYSKFGRKADKRIEGARRLHSVLVIANLFAREVGIQMNPIEVKEPLLNDVEDLWRFWGAKWQRVETKWYSPSSEWQSMDLPNPVR